MLTRSLAGVILTVSIIGLLFTLLGGTIFTADYRMTWAILVAGSLIAMGVTEEPETKT